MASDQSAIVVLLSALVSTFPDSGEVITEQGLGLSLTERNNLFNTPFQFNTLSSNFRIRITVLNRDIVDIPPPVFHSTQTPFEIFTEPELHNF